MLRLLTMMATSLSPPPKYGLAAARSDHVDNLSGERDSDGSEGGRA